MLTNLFLTRLFLSVKIIIIIITIIINFILGAKPIAIIKRKKTKTNKKTDTYAQYVRLNNRRTRSQAVARRADRTALPHLRRSRNVIGHVTI